MSVRAKFRCMSVTTHHTRMVEVRLRPVYNNAKGDYEVPPENQAFWDATPAGEITMTINNPDASAQFIPGQAFYVDFSIADG